MLFSIEVCCVKIVVEWAEILAVLFFFMSYQTNITQHYQFSEKIFFGTPYLACLRTLNLCFPYLFADCHCLSSGLSLPKHSCASSSEAPQTLSAILLCDFFVPERGWQLEMQHILDRFKWHFWLLNLFQSQSVFKFFSFYQKGKRWQKDKKHSRQNFSSEARQNKSLGRNTVIELF